ncbi:MAG: heme-copper oxidase subunit III [Bacteroidota bacterium]
MNIPYTSTARPDSGLYNAKLGVWLFLASEVMLFGALFSSYILLRVSAETWPHGYTILNIPLATLNTVVLISSSVTMVMSWASLMMKDFKKYKRYMGLTVLAGFGFLIIKGFEYSAKFEHHLYPSENTFMAIYFTLTGLHGLHVIGGIILNGYLLGPGSKMWKTDPVRFTNRIEVAGLYWHFVDLVWIFLFPVLYLL